MSAVRDKADFGFATFADAALLCMCSGAHFASQRISPEQPLRGSKLGIPKPPFRCKRFQQLGRGTKCAVAAAAPMTAFGSLPKQLLFGGLGHQNERKRPACFVCRYAFVCTNFPYGRRNAFGDKNAIKATM